MSYLPNLSIRRTTFQPNESFVSLIEEVGREYVSIAVSIDTNEIGGHLWIYYSNDSFEFCDFQDNYEVKDCFHVERSIKGRYIKIRYENGNSEASISLSTKLNYVQSEGIDVNINHAYDSVTVYNGEEGGLNIRHLNATDDNVNLPQLNPLIINDEGVTTLNVTVNSMPPIVIPPITISDINIHDSNGNNILSNSSGYLQTEIMNTSLTVSGSVSVSNQISGYALNSTLTSTNSKLDSLITGTRILASNGNTISTANGNLLTNLYANSPSGYAPLSSGTPQNTTFNALMVMNKDTIKATVGGVIGDLAGTNVSGRGVSLYVDETNSSSILSGITGIQNILSNQGIHILEWDSGITVNNFPDGITHVNIDNEVSVTGSVNILEWNSGITVNNFPDGVTHVNIDNEVSVTGSVHILEWGSGITVNNFPAGVTHVNIDNVVGVTGSVHIFEWGSGITVNNFPDGITHVNIDNEVSVTGTVLVSNFPAGVTHVNIDNQVSVTGTVIVSNLSDIVINSDSLIQAINDVGGATTLNCFTDINNNNRNYLYTNDKLLNDKIKSTTITGETGINCYITNTMANPANVAIHGTHGGTVKDIDVSAQGAMFVELHYQGKTAQVDNNGCLFNTLLDKDGHHLASNNFSGALYSQFTTDTLINEAWNITDTSINVTLASAPLVKLEDGNGNKISSTVGVGSTRSLDTYINGGSVQSVLYAGTQGLTQTTNGVKHGLDCNIINSTAISTTDTNISTAFDTINNAVKVNLVANTGTLTTQIQDSDGSKILVDGVSTNNLKTVDKNVALAYNGTATAISTVGKSYTGTSYVNNSCDASGYQNMNIMNSPSVKISDSSGGTLSALNGALKSTLYGSSTSNNIGDTSSSYNGTTKIGINAFVSNGASTPVVCGGVIGVSGTIPTPLKLDANNNLSTVIDSTGNSIKVSDGTNTASVRDIGTAHSTSGIKGLETCANLYAAETTLLNNQPLSCTYNSGFGKTQLNVADVEGNQNLTFITSYTSSSKDSLTAMNTKMVQGYNTTNNAKEYIIAGVDANNKIGLNVYQIFPKKLYYNMGGYSAYNVGNALMAGWGNNLTYTNLSTSNSTWYWNLDSTTTGNWVIIYDYINSSGDLVANQSQTVATTNGTTVYVPIAGGVSMKGVIRWRFDTFRNVSFNLYITPSNSASAPLGITFNHGGGNLGAQSSNLMGVMIVPNGYVAYIPQFSYVGGANMNVCLVKFTDITGSGGVTSPRQLLNKYYYVNLTSKEITAGSGGGGIGGVFMPGDRFCLMTLDSTATARWSNIDVVLEAI